MMKKRILSLLLALALCLGLAVPALAAPALTYRTATSYNADTGIQRRILDPQGYDLRVCFEIPVFSESTDGYKKINAFFRQLDQRFFSAGNENLTNAWEYVTDEYASYTPYYYEWKARVGAHTEELVSVSLGYDWYMGGVVDMGTDTYTFDTRTGQPMTLRDVTGLNEEELRGVILTAAQESDADEVIDYNYLWSNPIDNFGFFIDRDGFVSVCFDKYEAAAGYAGPITLDLPCRVSGERCFQDAGPDKWCYPYVQWAAEQNITSGTGEDTFSPNQTCTQAQILTMIYAAAGKPSYDEQCPYRNVEYGDYFYDAVNWAWGEGILTADSFSPSAPCTRADVVTYLWRYAGSPAAEGAVQFPDVPAGADCAPAVAWAVDAGVTKGMEDGTFAPGQTCTRAQIVTFLKAALG